MKRTRMVLLALAVAASLAGCQTRSTSSGASASLGAMTDHQRLASADGAYRLGAGDALGHELFSYYVTTIRSDQYYATGGSEFPTGE
jgi:hypothetical protein